MTMTADEEKKFKELIRKAKDRAKEKGVPFDLDVEMLNEAWLAQGGRCPWCGIQIDLTGVPHIPGVQNDMRVNVDRKVPANGYVKENVQMMHFLCNRLKGTVDRNTAYAFAKRIVEKFETDNPATTVRLRDDLQLTLDGKAYFYPEYKFIGSATVEFGGAAIIGFGPAKPSKE
jgi:hypothetical protein